MGSTSRQAIRYVSKFPPSPSGVALYAAVFADVLSMEAEVRRLDAPSLPADSQSLKEAVKGFVAGYRLGRGETDHVYVELSGRALFEFYFCLGLSISAERISYEVTCHDSPSVVGASMLFRVLDRRGLRRVGVWLSKTLGIRLENRVLLRAERVWCLTRAGARTLETRYHVPVMVLPHVVGAFRPRPKEHEVFIPGPLHDPDLVSHVLARSRTTWPIVIGNCTEEVERAVRAVVGDRAQLTFTGFVDEAALLEHFDRAAVVLRIRGTGDEGNQCAASGPLSWAAGRGCLCITDDPRAGATELAEEGLVILSDDLGKSLDEVTASFTPERSQAIAERAASLMGVGAVAAVRRAKVVRAHV